MGCFGVNFGGENAEFEGNFLMLMHVQFVLLLRSAANDENACQRFFTNKKKTSKIKKILHFCLLKFFPRAFNLFVILLKFRQFFLEEKRNFALHS